MHANDHNRNTTPSRAMIWLIATILALLAGGCEALPLATLGPVLGIAGTAASTGTEVYNFGKLDLSLMASFDECRSAALAAAHDLHLRIGGKKYSGEWLDQFEMELVDDRNKSIVIRVDRRTERLCQCRVDVGIFGSEPTAKLIARRIRRHLPRSADALEGDERQP